MCRSDIHHLTVKLYILYWINLLIIYHYWTSDWLNRDQVSIVIFRYSFAPETWLMRTRSVSETGQGLSLAPLEPRIHRTRGLTKCKTDFCSDETCCFACRQVSLFRELLRQPSEEHAAFSSHTAEAWKDERCEQGRSPLRLPLPRIWLSFLSHAVRGLWLRLWCDSIWSMGWKPLHPKIPFAPASKNLSPLSTIVHLSRPLLSCAWRSPPCSPVEEVLPRHRCTPP